MRALLLALAFALTACAAPQAATPAAAPAEPAAAQPQVNLNADAAACAARGGDIRPVCMMGRPMCVIRYPDAGRECRGDADCEGKCFAKGGGPEGEPAVGHCQATSNPCGCNTPVENGRAGPLMCVD